MKNATDVDFVNQTFLRDYPTDAAMAIDELRKSEAVEFLNRQPAATIAAVWPYLSPARVDEILPELDESRLAEVLEALDPGICAGILRRSSEGQRRRYVSPIRPRRKSNGS